MRAYLRSVVIGLGLILLAPSLTRAALTGPERVLMLRVYFGDVTNATRFTASDVGKQNHQTVQFAPVQT